MNLQCRNCNRSFDLDQDRAAGVVAVQCLCGERLPLVEEASQGQRLGKYVLVHRIAVGGMGEIYYGKVSGVEGFEKEVAIKRMLPHLSSDRNFINMMVKEAKLTVLLNHPNIVQVYDLARQGDEYYIAMEYVPGLTVGTILEQARRASSLLPTEVAVHIVSQILRGLGYAHDLTTPNGERLSILHRDITPQNILVTQGAYVKITDFGIAKAVNEISTTSPGMIKGKLGYIAPEQLTGREPDSRVDLFCAGILLWEMLAVRRLFKGNSEVDTFRLIAECKVPPLAGFRDDVPAALEAVIVKALAADPDQRFGRAEDFNAALAAAIAPRTFDHLTEATRAYFAAHDEYFADVVTGAYLRGLYETSEDTRMVGAEALQAAGPEAPLEPVSKYLRLPPPLPTTAQVAVPAQVPRRPRRAALGLAALLLAAGLAGTLAWLQRRPSAALAEARLNAPPLAAVPLAAPPTPPAPAPLPAPAPAALPEAAPAPAPTPPVAARPAGRARGGAEAAHRALTGPEIQAVVARQSQEIQSCLSKLGGEHALGVDVVARMVIEPTGQVGSVELEPAIGQREVEGCVTRALRSTRFRRNANGMKVRIPLRIQVN